MSKTAYESVAMFNELIGNRFGRAIKSMGYGKQASVCSKSKLMQADHLIKEETKELSDAFENNDLVEYIDALADIVVVCYGALHAVGVSGDCVLDEVLSSNMTKFHKSKEEAIKTQKHYERLGIETEIVVKTYIKEPENSDEAQVYYSVVCAKDTYVGTTFYPKGKLLKPTSYVPPNIRKFLIDVNEEILDDL